MRFSWAISVNSWAADEAMDVVSNTPVERARKAYSMILLRLQPAGTQIALAASMGVSETTISRFKTEHLETLCSLLAHLGLKVVPVEMQCFPQERVQALLTLSKAHLESIANADQLRWD